jgi:hypothetical protein
VLRGGYPRSWLYVGLVLYFYILHSHINHTSGAVVATIARFPYVQDLATLDSLFAQTDLAIWSHVEIGIALIASSAATFRPLLKLFRHWTYQNTEMSWFNKSCSTERTRTI